jgi:hypothetical protein
MTDPNNLDAGLVWLVGVTRNVTAMLDGAKTDLNERDKKLTFLSIMAHAMSARLRQYPETSDVAEVWGELSRSLSTVSAGQVDELLDPRLYRDGRPGKLTPNEATIMGIAAGVYDLKPNHRKSVRANEIALAIGVPAKKILNFKRNLTKGDRQIKDPLAINMYDGVLRGCLRVDGDGNLMLANTRGPSPVDEWLKWLKRYGRYMV